MHVPDGFLDIPTSVGTAAVAAGAIALSLARQREQRLAPTTPEATR